MSNEPISSPQYLLDPQTQTHFFLKFKESLSSLIQSFQSECFLQPSSSNFTANHSRFFCTKRDLDITWFANHANPMLQVGIDTINGLNTSAWDCMKLLISDFRHLDLRSCKPTSAAENSMNIVLYIIVPIIFVLCIATCIWIYSRRIAMLSAKYPINNTESDTGHNSNATPSESTKLLERKSADPHVTERMESVQAHL